MLIVSPLAVDVPVPCALWRIELDQPVDDDARATLSADERSRAGRFVFAHDRHRHVAAHAALRQVLARSPEERAGLRFATGAQGKPVLVGAPAAHFNLSHSQDIALVAASAHAEVGVDVERMRPMPDAQALAAAYFTPAEQRSLAALRDSPSARDRAFLVCWTRKEACLKALGTGLTLATDAVEVGTSDLGGDARIVTIETPQGAERLWLRSFDGATDAVAALALRATAAAAFHPIPAGAATPAKAFA